MITTLSLSLIVVTIVYIISMIVIFILFYRHFSSMKNNYKELFNSEDKKIKKKKIKNKDKN